MSRAKTRSRFSRHITNESWPWRKVRVIFEAVQWAPGVTLNPGESPESYVRITVDTVVSRRGVGKAASRPLASYTAGQCGHRKAARRYQPRLKSPRLYLARFIFISFLPPPPPPPSPLSRPLQRPAALRFLLQGYLSPRSD